MLLEPVTIDKVSTNFNRQISAS